MDRRFEVLCVTNTGIIKAKADELRRAKYRVTGAETVHDAEKVIDRIMKSPRPGRAARHLGAIILGPSFIFGDNPLPHYKNRDWHYIHERREDTLPPGAAVVDYARALNAGTIALISVGLPWHPPLTPEQLRLTDDEKTRYAAIVLMEEGSSELSTILDGPLGQAISRAEQ